MHKLEQDAHKVAFTLMPGVDKIPYDKFPHGLRHAVTFAGKGDTPETSPHRSSFRSFVRAQLKIVSAVSRGRMMEEAHGQYYNALLMSKFNVCVDRLFVCQAPGAEYVANFPGSCLYLETELHRVGDTGLAKTGKADVTVDGIKPYSADPDYHSLEDFNEEMKSRANEVNTAAGALEQARSVGVVCRDDGEAAAAVVREVFGFNRARAASMRSAPIVVDESGSESGSESDRAGDGEDHDEGGEDHDEGDGEDHGEGDDAYEPDADGGGSDGESESGDNETQV